MAATGECLCERSAAEERSLPIPPGTGSLHRRSLVALCEELTMGQRADQMRLAITVFDKPRKLELALQILISQGFSQEQLCVAALDATTASVQQSSPSERSEFHEISALLEQAKDWPGLADGHRIVATSGPLLDTLTKGSANADGADGAGSGDLRAFEIGSELVPQLMQGCIALIVRSMTAAQHVIATRALLRESSQRVRTYDYTIAGRQTSG